MVNERIQGLAEIYVQRMLISSLNQAPAILNSSIFKQQKKTTQNLFIPAESISLSVSHICEAEKKPLRRRLHHCESWDNSFFPPFPYVYTTRSISLVKTLTMRDNELKSISSSLTHSLTRLPHTPSSILCGKIKNFYMYFFWWMCVHNMKYVYRMRWKKKEEKKCWTQNMEA